MKCRTNLLLRRLKKINVNIIILRVLFTFVVASCSIYVHCAADFNIPSADFNIPPMLISAYPMLISTYPQFLFSIIFVPIMQGVKVNHIVHYFKATIFIFEEIEEDVLRLDFFSQALVGIDYKTVSDCFAVIGSFELA